MDSFRIFNRDGFTCQRCKTNQILTIHHVLHKEFGGSDRKENLISLCFDCHKKWHRLFLEFMNEVGRDEAKKLIRDRFWLYLYSQCLETVEQNKRDNVGRPYSVINDMDKVIPRKKKKKKRNKLPLKSNTRSIGQRKNLRRT